jgi:hypothetical protein
VCPVDGTGLAEVFDNMQVSFPVLTATRMKMAVFWDVAMCSQIHIDMVSEVLTASIIRTISSRL